MGTEVELIEELKMLGWKTRRVRINHMPECDSEYMVEVWKARKQLDGKTGVIFASHNSHGLCFEVRVEGVGEATYEPCELTPVE